MKKPALCLAAAIAMVSACVVLEAQAQQPPRPSDGPMMKRSPAGFLRGDAAAGKDVFRFETFGNEGFWTEAMRLPKGVMDEKFTPVQALDAGLHVDIDALDATMQTALAQELRTDLAPKNAPMLNDVETTVKLIEANAVIGVVPKDTNRDGRISIASGDRVGIACAICHTITDKSVFEVPGKGTIGRRLDGRATHSLNMGALLALAANSRAYYPNLQLELAGKTIGRAPQGLTKDSTEAEVDAYLKNAEFYPVGTFDETQDGNGNPVQNTPLFRQDLAGPYGSAGEFQRLEDISNGSYTTNLDLTTLATPEGRQFLKLKGGASGEEIADNYVKILEATGVRGYPYVASTTGHPVGEPASPVGRKVDPKKILDLNAYLADLQAPRGAVVEAVSFAGGRELFRSNCTGCHNVDQRRAVPLLLVEMNSIWPAYRPMVLANRKPPLSPIQDSKGIFDDKMIVVDASDRGEIRGNALPLLLDLARKPMFLHDASVPSLDSLLDPSRGAAAPHPFYIPDGAGRKALVEFLRALDTGR